MNYLYATKIHSVISPALYNVVASDGPLNDVSMSPQGLQIMKNDNLLQIGV